MAAPSVTQAETRELRRVFDFLASFAPKQALRHKLEPVRARHAALASALSGAASGSLLLVDGAGAELRAGDVEAELLRLGESAAALQRRLDALSAINEDDKRIHARDLQLALAFLGKHADKHEVEDMVWEVDENLDGCIDWQEFVLMFRRNIADKTGLEPSRVFNVVQFCMYDRDFSGRVSLDETMRMLFARYGKERLEAEVKLLFGEKLYTEGNGSLTFVDYLSTIGAKGPPGHGGGDGKPPRLARSGGAGVEKD